MPPPPPPLPSSLSLCLLQLIITHGLLLPTQADTLGPRHPQEGQGEGVYVERQEEGEEEEEWVLEEESVMLIPSLHKRQPSGERRWVAGGDIWWQVVVPEDPAKGAEPARWDGWPTLHHHHYPLHTHTLPPPHLPTDYEVLQEAWVEDAVT